MATLYALLVSIDKYPIPRHRLRGCSNDRAEMNGFLKRYAKAQGMSYKGKMLSNKTAKRQDIIDGFQHFKAATSGDCCLFYYSGHGSQAKAPQEFWNNPTGLNESIVCYDSRLADGRDLMDKELAYLIWEATQNKGIHFVSIMDCCHSGSATRTLVKERYRSVEANNKSVELEDYYGYSTYFKDHLTPPGGRHVHLAASADYELAKEKYLDHSDRGVFTYCLLQVLQQGGTFQSYEELMHRTRIKVTGTTTQQHPQLELVGTNGSTGFLGRKTTKGLSYLISYDRPTNRWLLQAGAVQNIVPSQPDFSTTLALEDGTVVTVVRVHAHQSEVSGMEGKDPDQQYAAQLQRNATPPLSIGIDPNLPQNLKDVLTQNLEDYPTIMVHEDLLSPKYLVQYWKDALVLVRPGEKIPVFKRVPVRKTDQEDTDVFLQRVAAVAQWEGLLLHYNPNSAIHQDDIRIEISLESCDGQSKAEVVTDPTVPVILPYCRQTGEWQKPKFRLRIVNENPYANYWVSAVYLSSTFGIDNQYLRKQRLPARQEVWMTYLENGQFKMQFEAFVNSAYLKWGINRISDYIKIFVSTDEALDTDSFLQEDLDLDFGPARGIHKAIGKPSQANDTSGWMVRDVELAIQGPDWEVPVTDHQFNHLPGLSIKGSEKLIAKASLTDYRSAETAFQQAIPNCLTEHKDRPVPISPGLIQSNGLHVLELYHLNDRNLVNTENPIQVKLNRADEQSVILPFGYDRANGAFYRVGYSNGSGMVLLESLPTATPTEKRKSKDGSIKVFFQQIDKELDLRSRTSLADAKLV
ncbi:caspase family protein [Flavilitoribacter nigricans]|uniref:Peptidase C14 caspase domain-containing protein n=1 Tax=Flavilitoribacter nigricans (strain ATCC 23147 / DSM 23189 / NBRC 102662 / NCIMB 1420 / SS-2) TaxID=1122177 RepID=A0A2D0N1K3_FLAN2|nr:caspase family protein [Flavilitoribacter nigricans]PHN02009.1 hypothetical protein CRP01_34450 [Flavilitoribacter nigricans DSM 23189 = NBRC 102662]